MTATADQDRTQAQARYSAYLDTPRWKALRYLRRRLDGGRCRVCNGAVRLEVHHRSYRHRGRSFFGELRDCITLCSVCHRAAHERGLCG